MCWYWREVQRRFCLWFVQHPSFLSYDCLLLLQKHFLSECTICLVNSCVIGYYERPYLNIHHFGTWYSFIFLCEWLLLVCLCLVSFFTRSLEPLPSCDGRPQTQRGWGPAGMWALLLQSVVFLGLWSCALRGERLEFRLLQLSSWPRSCKGTFQN